jgi:hypothetical protein
LSFVKVLGGSAASALRKEAFWAPRRADRIYAFHIWWLVHASFSIIGKPSCCNAEALEDEEGRNAIGDAVRKTSSSDTM